MAISLFLVELAALGPWTAVASTIERVKNAARGAGARVVETTWAETLQRLYVILETETDTAVAQLLQRAELDVLDVAPVRLIGTPAEAEGVAPSHLVEWDLPRHLGMDQYLKRKAEKTPLYAQAPDVKFLRTYVREDMVKCVCLYDAPDDDAVRRAREIVSAPVDRLARLTREEDDR